MKTATARSSITNITRIEALLDDPSSDISLDDLKVELNELAKLRNNSRLAFCKRLAIAYLIVVGRKIAVNAGRDGGTTKFQQWCDANIRSANDKRYSSNTIKAYLTVGFASNPEKYYEGRTKINRDCARIRHRKDERDRKIGLRLVAATEEPRKPISVIVLKSRYDMPSDVAKEVNILMTAWEQASVPARKQFLNLVGK